MEIVSDGGCDLSEEFINDNNLEIVPCYVSFDGSEYLRNYVDISVGEFYDKIAGGNVFPSTSLPSIQDYYDVFNKFIKERKEVICICMTSNLSGSFQSAVNAKDMLIEKYKDVNIHIIDSRMNTVLQGLLVQECVRMRNLKLELKDIVKHIEEIKNTGKICFTIENMKYLIKGGRIQNLIRLINVNIGVKPILMLRDGEHHFIGMTRSRRKSIDKILETVYNYFINHNENPKDYLWVVGAGMDMGEANILKKSLEDRLDIKIGINVQRIGVVIASHTGPHPIGVAWIKKYIGGGHEEL